MHHSLLFNISYSTPQFFWIFKLFVHARINKHANSKIILLSQHKQDIIVLHYVTWKPKVAMDHAIAWDMKKDNVWHHFMNFVAVYIKY